MPFTINEDNCIIKGRRGDSASFDFNFDTDISSYCVSFYVKKKLDSDECIIEKNYPNPISNSVIVNLSEEETLRLSAKPFSYSIYYWGLKIKNGANYVQTVIPEDFKNPPEMHIYPNIGDDNNED